MTAKSQTMARLLESLDNPVSFIQCVRNGVAGFVVRDAVERFGHCDLFASILKTSASNLHYCYQRRALDPGETEVILDALRVLEQACQLWGSDDDALLWLETPVPALGNAAPLEWFDTFEGRAWVRQVLRKTETGDFIG